MTELDKVFSPGVVEKRWYDHWQEKGYFHAEPDSGKQPYTIVIPPQMLLVSLPWVMY